MRKAWILASLVACVGEHPVDPTEHGTIPPTDGGQDTGETIPDPPTLEVVINEVMPGNQSTIDTPGGARSDWIELVNLGSEAVALSELQLRNGEGERWQGPEGRELAPDERLLVWADEGDASLGLFTGFTLDKDGDKLTLLDRADRVLDYLDLEAVDSDISWARTPDKTGEFAPTAWPTPEAENREIPSPTLNPADETLFLPYVMHRIDFAFTRQAYDRINLPSRPEVHVGLTIDGVSYPDIGLKLKGSASYQDMTGKPAFMVDLNNWVEGTKFRGLKAFKLHNGVVLDPTRNRDWLTYQLAREAGLMAPRVGWAEVYCNDVYYGLYILIEKHDDEFIEHRRPGQQDLGVMLEPNEASSGWFGGDFGNGNVLTWNHEEGPIPADPLTIESLTRADELIAGPATNARVEELWSYFDKERFLTYLAWETLVMHTDGYRAVNNWRVFVDGSDYKIDLIPSGVEWTWDFDLEPWSFGGRAASWCISNRGCRREYAERILEVADLVEALDLHGQFLDQQAWLDPYIRSDPRYNGAWDTLPSARRSTLQHLQENPGRARRMVYDAFPELEP